MITRAHCVGCSDASRPPAFPLVLHTSAGIYFLPAIMQTLMKTNCCYECFNLSVCITNKAPSSFLHILENHASLMPSRSVEEPDAHRSMTVVGLSLMALADLANPLIMRVGRPGIPTACVVTARLNDPYLIKDGGN
eukprot:scaffold167926_cov20-Prasinocladus_malaysianus.AAC.1